MSKKLTQRQLKLKADTIAEQMFKTFGNCRTFNIMHLGIIMDSARGVILTGGTEEQAEAAIKKTMDVYEVKK